MNIAQGSLEELRYYFILARDLGYVRRSRAGLGLRKSQMLDDVARLLSA